MIMFIIGLILGAAIVIGYEMYQTRKAMNTYGEYELIKVDSNEECDAPEYEARHRAG